MLIWVNSLSKKQTGLIKNDQEPKDKLTPIKTLKCSPSDPSSGETAACPVWPGSPQRSLVSPLLAAARQGPSHGDSSL